MAWSTIRKATEEDSARVSAAADRFCRRYGIAVEDGEAVQAAELAGQAPYGGRADEVARATLLRRRFLAAVRRALREPGADGIAYGYVGSWVD